MVGISKGQFLLKKRKGMIHVKKHSISSDESLNRPLKEDVTTLRGGIVDQAEKVELPSRFAVEPHKDLPRMIITDTETDKSIEVPLFAYGEVRKVLSSLF
jgi:hypothetical protein